MQSLDIISVNLWGILASLANLLIIYIIVKKIFFGPVRKLIEARKAEIDKQYAAADEAEKLALGNKAEWEEKMKTADSTADGIVRDATETANHRAERIIDEANAQAELIKARAVNEAALTRKQAEESIKREIVDVSSALAEKVLEREIDESDHRALIDSFIDGVGENN